jgi:hypothetical protein
VPQHVTLATVPCDLPHLHMVSCALTCCAAMFLQCLQNTARLFYSTLWSSLLLYTSGFQCCMLPWCSGFLGVMGSCQMCQRLHWHSNRVPSPMPSLLPTQPNTAMATSAHAKASVGCLTHCTVASLGSADSPLSPLTHMYLVGSNACPVYIPVHSGDWVLRLDHLVPYKLIYSISSPLLDTLALSPCHTLSLVSQPQSVMQSPSGP